MKDARQGQSKVTGRGRGSLCYRLNRVLGELGVSWELAGPWKAE